MISLLLASGTGDTPGIPEPIAIIIGAVIAAVSGFTAVFAQTKFQRIAERILCSSSRLPGDFASCSGGIVLR